MVLGAAALFFSCSTPPKEPEAVETKRNIADSLMAQGYERTDRLELSAAWNAFDQALNVYASLDDRSGMINALLAMGRSRRMSGDDEAAEELFLHAGGLAAFSGNPVHMRSVLNYRADLAIRQGNPVQATDLLSDRPEDSSSGRERAEQLRLRAVALYDMGREEEALALLSEAAALAEESDEALEAAQSYYKLASIASLGARFDEAREWALRALSADRSREYAPGIAADLRALAIISAKSGDNGSAEDYYRRAWLAWRALGRPEEAEAARLELEVLTGRPVTLP
jgi:tetratricopeptide (TPR) repeat protein